MKLYLIRHGETQFNLEKKYQGNLDIPLSEKGKNELKQADFTAENIHVSTLTRAKQTAEILFPNSNYIENEDLREMNFGVFEGRSPDEMENDEQYRSWTNGMCEGRCPGGEKRDEFIKRICTATDKIIKEAIELKRDKVVIVAHGGTQMAILSTFSKPKKEYFAACSKNGSGYVFEIDENKWEDEKVLYLIEEYLNV